MTELPHILPSERCMVKNVLINWKERDPMEDQQALYEKKIIEFEKGCEESIIKTLSKLDVNATVKTDRYSLPFKEEIVVTLNGESYLNGPYEFFRVARKVVKEILNRNIYKMRFYIYINLLPGEGVFGGFGKVEYRFRYYPHDPMWSK